MNKDYKHVTTIRVRYSETDMMGIVYNSNYYTWFEIARTELCRTWGVPYSEWEKKGLLLPVVESHCRYKLPAKYDDEIQLWVRVVDVKVHCLTFDYRLIRSSDYKLIAEGWSKHGCTDRLGKLYKKEHPFYLWIVSNSVENDTTVNE
ncbi:MAG: thioesterase family protein [Synergistaceae bacterium]